METPTSKQQSTLEALINLLPKSTEEVLRILKDKDPKNFLESSVLGLVSKTCDLIYVKQNVSKDQLNWHDLQSNLQPNAKIDTTSIPNIGNCEDLEKCEDAYYVKIDSVKSEENRKNSKGNKPVISDLVKSPESKTDFVKCRENCDILIDYTWEKLNTGYWKDVPVAWRYTYTVVSMLKMFVEVHLLVSGDSELKFSDVMKTCDMGLLMGAPLMDNILARMSACITLLNPGSINVTCKASVVDVDDDTSAKTKRQKLSDTIDKFSLDPLCSLDKTKSIQRVSCPSLESFQKNFLNSRVPVIVTDAMDFWPAMSNKKWTLDYIKSVSGTRTVPIEIGAKYTEDSWSQTLMTIKDFIEKYVEDPSNPKGYLAQHQLFDQIPELQNDISVPTYCCLGTSEDVDVNAWFGPKGTVSPLHYDDKDNLLAQVMGSKYVRLYSDEFTPCVYPHPQRLLHNTSQVDVEHPNYQDFPKFQTAPYTDCILNPGEMLFIPSKFWHFVKSLSVSFSVSFWWK